MNILLATKHQGMELFPELQDLLTQMFAVMPNLEYESRSTRNKGLEDKERVCEVIVYDGEQKLGRVGYIKHYTRHGYETVYQIISPKIIKSRGDKHSKKTKSLKSALTIAKQVFVRESDKDLLNALTGEVKRHCDNMVWHASSNYNSMCNSHYAEAFSYVVSMVEGNPQGLSQNLSTLLASDKFKEARSNYRIAKTVQHALNRLTGGVVYIDRENKLTLADLETQTITKVESTYDLPKNYQEKYTILKIMDFNQPIEGVGVKFKLDVYEQHYECYYLKPGDTLVTH